MDDFKPPGDLSLNADVPSNWENWKQLFELYQRSYIVRYETPGSPMVKLPTVAHQAVTVLHHDLRATHTHTE